MYACFKQNNLERTRNKGEKKKRERENSPEYRNIKNKGQTGKSSVR